FAAEAEALFDTLSVKVCPSCMQALAEPPGVEDGACTLCHQPIRVISVDGPDLAAELRATRSRLDELAKYISAVARERDEAGVALAVRETEEATARRVVDQAVAPVVAPFLSQRDELVARRESLVGEARSLVRAFGLYAGVTQREQERDRLHREMEALQKRIKELEASRPSRGELVADLSARFLAILEAFGFPKLSDAYLDDDYVPHVRGRRYSELSSGGRTLVGVAWQWSILELATERGAAHPGFTIVDGIQKNLTPVGENPDPEFGKQEIINRVYAHALAWLVGAGASAQILIVDNRPPTIAEESIVAYYSGRPDHPPYGLIDDAIA
ncbi:MAG: hypothetical protein ACYC65_08915, partial [Candidatus Limnocylindrales bacterium]